MAMAVVTTAVGWDDDDYYVWYPGADGDGSGSAVSSSTGDPGSDDASSGPWTAWVTVFSKDKTVDHYIAVTADGERHESWNVYTGNPGCWTIPSNESGNNNSDLSSTLNSDNGTLKPAYDPELDGAWVFPQVSLPYWTPLNPNSRGKDYNPITKTINQPPVFLTLNNLTVKGGKSMAFSVYATDADGQRITFSIDKLNLLPGGATFKTNTFQWKPPIPPIRTTGKCVLYVKATDGLTTSIKEVTITVTR